MHVLTTECLSNAFTLLLICFAINDRELEPLDWRRITVAAPIRKLINVATR